MNDNLSDAGFLLFSSWQGVDCSVKFSGIAFLSDAIVIGQNGIEAYQRCHGVDPDRFCDGRFSLVAKVDNFVLAKCDATGQDILYFYDSPRGWGVSNSLLALAEHVTANGEKLTLNRDVARALTVNDQLLSHETLFNEISVLPADKMLRVDLGCVPHRVDTVKIHDLSSAERISKDRYDDLLRTFCIDSMSRTRALLNAFGANIRIDLTGGHDSRSVLALIMGSGVSVKDLNFCSNINANEDYEIATLIANKFDFEIVNNKPRRALSNGSRSYTLWKYGNFGVYKPVYIPLSSVPLPVLHFHGAGGGNFRLTSKLSAGEVTRRAQRRIQDSEIRDSFVRQMTSAFNSLDVDIESPDSMMIHYRFFRSRFHFGRGAVRNLSGLMYTPLSCLNLVHASRYFDLSELARSKIYLDIMLFACPDLLNIKFDDERKAFTSDEMLSSSFFGKHINIESSLRTLSVFGLDELMAESTVSHDDDERSMFWDLLMKEANEVWEYARDENIFKETHFEEAMESMNGFSNKIKASRGLSHLLFVGKAIALSA